MTASLMLYTGPLSMFGMKAEIALHEKGVAFERIDVPYNAAQGYSPKHPDVVRINPKGQVPVLVDGDLAIFDSTQIFEYLEDVAPTPRLWPGNARARARARLLEHRSDEVYFPHVVRLMGLQDRLADPAAQQEIAAAQAFCVNLEREMGDAVFLSGDFGFTDIAFFMAQVFGERMGAPLTATTPGLLQWRRRVGERPAVKTVVARLVDYLTTNRRFIPSFMHDIAGARA